MWFKIIFICKKIDNVKIHCWTLYTVTLQITLNSGETPFQHQPHFPCTCKTIYALTKLGRKTDSLSLAWSVCKSGSSDSHLHRHKQQGKNLPWVAVYTYTSWSTCETTYGTWKWWSEQILKTVPFLISTDNRAHFLFCYARNTQNCHKVPNETPEGPGECPTSISSLSNKDFYTNNLVYINFPSRS